MAAPDTPAPSSLLEARFAGILRAAIDAIVTVDHHGRFIDFNPAAEQIFGYTRDEVLGREMAEVIVPPAMRERHRAGMARLAAGEAPRMLGQRIEMTALHATGREFPVELTITRIDQPDGVQVFAAHLRDITERKRTETQLLSLQSDLERRFAERTAALIRANRELERQIAERTRQEQVRNAVFRISEAALEAHDLPALFERTHAIIGDLMPAKNFFIALLSDDRRTLHFPRFIDEQTPSPGSRPKGRSLTDYIIDTGRPMLTTADNVDRLLEGTGYIPLGPRAPVWIGAPLMLTGGAIGAVVMQDYHNGEAYNEDDLRLLTFVAEQIAAAVHRHQANEARRRAEENYRSIFENALEGLYQSSVDGRFLRVNSALAAMCGYTSPDEMMAAVNDIGGRFYTDPRRRAEFFALVGSHDEVKNFESEISRKDGSTCWISESVKIVRDSRGDIAHFEGVAINITREREAARALALAKESADTASRAKSQFLASMSHELRTPLNGILGYTQILRRDDTLGPKQRHGLDIIHQSADHLLALINDVLDLSKIEARKLELHAGDFNLRDFAHHVEEMFLPRARERSLRFATDFAADLPRTVHGDEQRLRQIVFNLVGNAVKFTARGAVIFSVTPAEGDRVRFSVSDTGVGIAEDDLRRIFEPFTQVGSASMQAGGTGLGLAISRSLVERMGGQLRVESKPGWGSRFWFELPLPRAADPAPRSRRGTQTVRGVEGPAPKLLVVDDHAANRDVLVELLSGAGFVVRSAATGEEAIDAAATFQPALVLMDLRMAGMGGLAATRVLRARHGATLPIIAVSASAYDIDRRECSDAGCDDFLAKPVRETELWDILERHLGVRWRYDAALASPTPSETQTPFPFLAASPPEEDLAALHDLASQGDVLGIRARAEALATRDPRHAAFAKSVLELADNFKMKAIRQLIQRLRDPGSAGA